jgi:Ser-tRNA(Ala) deacylase AlaX
VPLSSIELCTQWPMFVGAVKGRAARESNGSRWLGAAGPRDRHHGALKSAEDSSHLDSKSHIKQPEAPRLQLRICRRRFNEFNLFVIGHPRLVVEMATSEEQAVTYLAFHHDGNLHELSTAVSSVRAFSQVEAENQQLFKLSEADDQLVIVCTKETIFHPQGGGQPSDEGEMVSEDGVAKFTVLAVRTDVVNNGQVLHLGRYTTASTFTPGLRVTQTLDVPKRLLYSRLHTAGHVLGSAVRHLLESEVPNFDELKASHFPGTAGCEFQGLIEGKWKETIQAKVDEYVEKDMPVEIEFWTEEDFRENGLERLIPDRSFLAPGEDKFRIVRIRGAEVYPCGGTHVEGTKACGKTTVKKIARSKGISRVSYTVD